MHKVHVIRLQNYSILQQLRLEEALLRADDRNWCLINEGSPPAIVMGISGKAHELIDQDILQKHPIPVIRRFSGGGTVIVDHNTTFVTFILNSQDINITCCPKKIMHWTEGLYRSAIGHADFKVQENDYAIGNYKFGGNAQYMRKGRWLHHSSLLWDYDTAKMDYLLLPKYTPPYRQNRSHNEFLCKLCDHVPSKEEMLQGLLQEMNHYFVQEEMKLHDIQEVLLRPHRRATEVV